MKVSEYFFKPLCQAKTVPVWYDIRVRLAQILGCEAARFLTSLLGRWGMKLGDEHGGDMLVGLKRVMLTDLIEEISPWPEVFFLRR